MVDVTVRELWGERYRLFELFLCDESWEHNPNVVLLRRAAELIERHNPALVHVTGITMCGDNEFQLFVCMDCGGRPLRSEGGG